MAKTWNKCVRNPALIWFVSVLMILCNVQFRFSSVEEKKLKTATRKGQAHVKPRQALNEVLLAKKQTCTL